jgi:hypothetical protein
VQTAMLRHWCLAGLKKFLRNFPLFARLQQTGNGPRALPFTLFFKKIYEKKT